MEQKWNSSYYVPLWRMVCMDLCCEMLNLVVLGQILCFRFRCWFSVMKIERGKPFFGLLVPIVFWVKVCPWILLVKMWMENEILLYPNKKGLEGVIALTRTRPLIAQALNRRAGQEGPTRCRPGWTRLLAACNRLQTAPPAFIESVRVPATRPSASRPAF